jgi:hypothetical protein
MIKKKNCAVKSCLSEMILQGPSFHEKQQRLTCKTYWSDDSSLLFFWKYPPPPTYAIVAMPATAAMD